MQIRIPLFVALAAFLLQESSAETFDALAREDGETGRIIGGQSAVKGQFPWATVLFYNDQFVCSSSIISPRTILTAAHCVVFDGVTQPASLFHAIANYRKSAEEVRIEFESVTPHPGYRLSADSIQNDIAILTTKEPIPFSGDVRNIAIARSGTSRLRYKHATAMGWGYTSRSKEPDSLPDELQYVEQKVVSNLACSAAYNGMPIENSKICAGFIRKGICEGDSGGPLVHLSAKQKPVEIGVASYVSGKFRCGSLPGVFTRVSSYNDFIKSAVDADLIDEV